MDIRMLINDMIIGYIFSYLVYKYIFFLYIGIFLNGYVYLKYICIFFKIR